MRRILYINFSSEHVGKYILCILHALLVYHTCDLCTNFVFLVEVANYVALRLNSITNKQNICNRQLNQLWQSLELVILSQNNSICIFLAHLEVYLYSVSVTIVM